MSPPRPSPIPAVDTPQLVPILVGAVPAGVVAYHVAAWLLGPGDPGPGPALPLLAAMVPWLATIAWVWFFAVWREPGGWDNVGFARLSGHWLRVSAFTAFGCFLLAGLLVTLFEPLLGDAAPPPPLLPEDLSAGTVALAILALCIVAPLAEELVFRGVLYGFLRQRWGIGAAALLSALPHAALHLDPVAMPGLTAVFILFAALYEHARSLWAPVVAHGLYNFTSTVWFLAGTSP